MSLLHRQIAERARLNPKRGGGMPWQVVTEPLTLLVTAVAGEMGSKPMQASVGALVYVTRSEMIERGIPVDTGLKDLNSDVRRQLVYADPTAARQSANDAREAADAGLPGSSVLREIADRLDKEATVNEARAKGKSEETVKKQINFSESFFHFKNRWDEFYFALTHENTTTLYDFLGNELPDKIDQFYVEYLNYVEAFKMAGGVLTKAPPSPSKAGDTHLPDVAKAVAETATSILKPIVYGGLVLGGLLIVPHILSSYGPRAPARR